MVFLCFLCFSDFFGVFGRTRGHFRETGGPSPASGPFTSVPDEGSRSISIFSNGSTNRLRIRPWEVRRPGRINLRPSQVNAVLILEILKRFDLEPFENKALGRSGMAETFQTWRPRVREELADPVGPLVKVPGRKRGPCAR